MYVVPKKNL